MTMRELDQVPTHLLLDSTGGDSDIRHPQGRPSAGCRSSNDRAGWPSRPPIRSRTMGSTASRCARSVRFWSQSPFRAVDSGSNPKTFPRFAGVGDTDVTPCQRIRPRPSIRPSPSRPTRLPNEPSVVHAEFPRTPIILRGSDSSGCSPPRAWFWWRVGSSR